MREQSELALNRGKERVAGARERDEEGVSLCVDFMASVGFKRIPQQPLVGRKHVRIKLT